MLAAIEDIYRRDSRRVFSTLVRLLGSLDAAEEALQDAFVAAAEQWPAQGVPANPVAWLVSAGRFKAIDKIRRQSRFVSWDAAPEVAEAAAAVPDEQAAAGSSSGTRAKTSKTTGCVLSSPAATPAWPRRRASHSPCARCAAWRPKQLRRPF